MSASSLTVCHPVKTIFLTHKVTMVQIKFYKIWDLLQLTAKAANSTDAFVKQAGTNKQFCSLPLCVKIVLGRLQSIQQGSFFLSFYLSNLIYLIYLSNLSHLPSLHPSLSHMHAHIYLHSLFSPHFPAC